MPEAFLEAQRLKKGDTQAYQDCAFRQARLQLQAASRACRYAASHFTSSPETFSRPQPGVSSLLHLGFLR